MSKNISCTTPQSLLHRVSIVRCFPSNVLVLSPMSLIKNSKNPIVNCEKWKNEWNSATLQKLSTIEKKGAFLLPKIEFSPSNQLRRKSLQVFKFSHDLIRLFIKKLKKFHKKNIFLIILLATSYCHSNTSFQQWLN